ncbi:MAG: hypothetical protein ACJ8NS_08340 [Chthoniobacterales bacterium]
MFSSFVRVVVFLAVAGPVFAALAAPQPGSVDPTLDAGRGPNLVKAWGSAALVQPDDKILVFGSFNAINLDYVPPLIRLNPDGSLDTSFDASNAAASHDLLPVAIQLDGRILFVDGRGGSGAAVLLRLNPDGSLDNSFSVRFTTARSNPTIDHVVVLGDGKIMIAGYFDTVNGVQRPQLVRVNPDGTLDSSFNPAKASSSFVVQSTGKIVIAFGDSEVDRLNVDGTLDNSFVVVTDPGSNANSLGSVLVQPDDRILWTIYRSNAFDATTSTLRRLNADGGYDPTFLTYTEFDYIGSLWTFVQQDGKLLINSERRLNADGTNDPTFKPAIAGGVVGQQSDGKLVWAAGSQLIRLFLDGSLDNSFAGGPHLTLIKNKAIDHAALLPNGKIVITGAFNYIDRVPRTGIAVLNSDGTPDLTFDPGTLLTLDTSDNTGVNSIAVQNEKILVAFNRNVVRLNPDGSVDHAFQFTPFSSGRPVGIVAVLGDGKILVYDGVYNFTLVRLLPDGSLDTSFQSAAPNERVALVQPDQRILLIGDKGLNRLNPDGSLDSGFSTADSIHLGYLEMVGGAALEPDGKYLVDRYAYSNFRELFFRLNSDGSSDASFNPDLVWATVAGFDQAGILLYGDIGPEADVGRHVPRAGVARLNSAGARDASFVSVPFSAGGFGSFLVQPDGQLIVTGGFDHVDGLERRAIVRLNDGSSRKLANISTRAQVGTGQSVEIAGFIISGSWPKKVIVRALGPSLTANGFGASQVLANPSLELHDASGAMIAFNDDWQQNESEVLKTGLQPADSLESAIVMTLAPGTYTAVIQGRSGEQGIALAELYDLDSTATSSLADISTRGMVNGGDQALIGGFILGGAEASTVVVRALGPSLGDLGISSPLSDPFLTVHDQSGTAVASNDNWKQTQQAELESHGLGCGSENDSALLTTLPPGVYTAVVTSANGGSGVGVVEVYSLPNP